MTPPPWILLNSRLPREPSRLRLGVWRRLRRLGAVLIHDAVWVLPADAKTREACEWLAEEIEEHGGTAWVWEAGGLSTAQDRALVELFRREADARYAEIASSAKAIRDATLRGRRRGRRARVKDADALSHALRQLRGLERALRLEARRDYFRAGGRGPAVAAVADAIAELEAQLLRMQPSGKGALHALGD
ncbi:MAG TPA: Chromate resistance protein ChrB [Gemmatimonadales bacterium]|nr:Chromate resistance protein ChrB [Gemmatimonadales bacterium]